MRLVQPIRAALAVVMVVLVQACASTAARPSAFPQARPAGETGSAGRATIPAAAATGPASVNASAAPASAPVAPSAAPAAADAILQTALGLRGVPYRLGGESPDTGFDCSGFVRHVFREHAIALPRTAAEQFTAGQPVARDALQTGDLVFFSTIGPGPTHVGLVIANGGRLEFVHAPADGSSVRVERLETGYWQRRWIGARRIL